MKRALKYSFATLCVLVVSAPVIYFVAVSAALRAHAAEDRIVFGSKRVEEAINDYTLKRGSAPRTLEALVPEFIESVLPLKKSPKSIIDCLPTPRNGRWIFIGLGAKLHGFIAELMRD